MLRLRTRVKPHDEMMARVVCRLELLRGLGEEIGAPVGDAADHAFLVEDDFTGGFGDSDGVLEGRKGCVEGGEVLFDFGEAARADLEIMVRGGSERRCNQ